MKVLITRPQPDADNFAQDCRSAGLDPIVAPLMTVAPRDDWETPVDAAALAFTSANGVRVFASASRVRSLVAFCVGEATADAAQAAGFSTVHAADGDVISLAETIAEHGRAFSGHIVHIAGARRAGDLIGLLRERGLNAHRIVAYETREAEILPEPAQGEIGSGRALAVALFSPRTAQLFLNLVAAANLAEALTRCRAVCLSPAVADIAGRATWRVVDVAGDRNAASMVALMSGRA